MGNCSPLTTMPFYEYKCQEHGRFEVRQPMFSDKVADCPKCGKPAERRISLPVVQKAREPITILQEQPYGQKPTMVDRIPDKSYSDEHNYDIPPDYPNLAEV